MGEKINVILHIAFAYTCLVYDGNLNFLFLLTYNYDQASLKLMLNCSKGTSTDCLREKYGLLKAQTMDCGRYKVWTRNPQEMGHIDK